MRHEIASFSAVIVGRERELDAVLRLLGGDADAARALVVLGDAGIGKSTLLEAAAAHARACGWRVLRADGSERETGLAFAALHQLLGPVLKAATRLPDRQRAALLGAFGLEGDGLRAPDQLLIGAALLTLLSDLAEERPVLVVVDDAQWIDRGSLDALAYAARRLDASPSAALLAARGTAAPAGLDRGLPALTLEPLARDASNQLLDRQPRPPAGGARLRVLTEAGGNPLALVEFAKTAAEIEADALPLTERLERIFAAQVAALPAPTRRLLLLAAAADGGDLAGLEWNVEDWAAAEEAGLVRLDGQRVRFRHPLMRSGVYHAAPLVARREAHLALAMALRDEPDRRAWHLAAASAGPDEPVAAALEASAQRARQRGGYAAAAGAPERAAQLSPDPAQRARRLALGADAATFAGQVEWVQELAGQAAAGTDDPGVRALASHSRGWALSQTTRHRAALMVLLRTADLGTPHAAVALVNAALVAYHVGEEEDRHRVRDAAARLGLPAGNPWRTWILAATDPFGSRAEVLADLDGAVGVRDSLQLGALGAAAWAIDHTACAVDLLTAALDGRRAEGALGGSASTYLCLGWAYADQGRWAEAQVAAAAAGAIAAEGRLELVTAATHALEAELSGVRGDTAAGRRQAAAALAAIDPQESRAIAVRARHAAGLAAVADGDHELAYEQLRMLFHADGTPVHFHASCYGLAGLAAAAARTGRRDRARQVVDLVAARLDGTASPRLALLVERGRALLADPDAAERHFAGALADPEGRQWPFERAQTELEYAQWLRRQRRRAADARPYLLAALETFHRLGARPWEELAQAELRASGVSLAPAEPDAFAELTPQQQQIIRLAARGLTNREIAERLFVSPRTVATHLYRSFPKLGITNRAQLRDILPQ
ncbi:helix-turn-helix transcriptional regulator [Phytohabitans rumicis]|uniref:helix-turn-helix transcriptional regulator n=1 Tax=Phytohabitans rumicis TaxID=1076125 RepID=UPI0031EC9B43